MPKYIAEYDTRIIEDDGWINESDTRLYEEPDEGDRIFWIDVDDSYSVSASILHIPTCDDFRWFARHIKSKKLTPYIKIRTFNIKENRVIGVCRISIYNPNYITGYNENMVLTRDIIDMLMDNLNTEFFSYTNNKVMTRWQWGISCVNSYYGSKKCKYMVPTGLKIPDYYKLLEDN